MSTAPTPQQIRDAAKSIEGQVVRTPSIYAPKLSALTGANLVIKYENLHITNSFKDRGALVKLLSLSKAERKKGVIAMSAGNHAQAVAYHAKRLKIDATIVMPEHTPFVKVANTESWGATVILHGETLSEAREHAIAIAQDKELVLVHPYDDPHIIAGQGTIALEMLEDDPDLECLLVPIGGGGLISGIAIAAKHINKDIEIIGVEAQAYPSMSCALDGSQAQYGTQTIADGIAVKNPGDLTLPIIQSLVSDIILVSENELECAIFTLLSDKKTIAEGAGAAALAALLKQPGKFKGKKVGLVLSGGNIDPRMLGSIMIRGLERQRKIVSLRIVVADQPGSLGRVTSLLGQYGANILEVSHRRWFLDVSAKGVTLDVMIETKNASHADKIVEKLENEGLQVCYLDQVEQDEKK